MKKNLMIAIAIFVALSLVIAALIWFFVFNENISNSDPNISASNNIDWQTEMETTHSEKIEDIGKNIDVTDEEKDAYRQMIGTSMDVKKSVVIMFNTFDECQEFIENMPPDYSTNIGVKAVTESDENGEYFNVVGNEVLETVFDNFEDGEHTNEPLEYAGVYCFLKRLGISSPIDSDEKLTEFIRYEKAQIQLMKEGLQ